MSDLRFGGSTQTGWQFKLTSGHPMPTPYHVQILQDGKLVNERPFDSKEDADRFVQEEKMRLLRNGRHA
jgi:hypothetical protein